MGVADIARQNAEIPVGVFRQREEQVSLRPAGMKRGNAAVSRVEELAGIAERMAKRLVRFPHVFQASGQAVEEFERREFPIHGQHGASGWFSKRALVKCPESPSCRVPTPERARSF